ncbi:hypothetical protein BSFA1_79410 (plasmid) [Burkholderia sp. SFA1]|uniref:Uncharacterized protein n=1 Tax=Burkholderia vietnamiensis (strain G4 / LMG 22486) TaxID=269482 RepID=A4JTW3_BURVG|nr:conserved hypothetical protein [Burkholderia vietnamiensis G4]AET95209.1 hypothetical protein BYI23_E000480 [Burkholderia sp. YI23]MCB4350125.1 hypothetical protein [Burkholderia vietnamiensis]BBQ02813.1 hypothetical protein BSFA1_79410 [Burkholderia sp. SFA1]
MQQEFGVSISATQIGMASMGCINDEGIPICPRFGTTCTGSRAIVCMGKAMQDFPEAQAEVLVAGLSIVSRSAKTIMDIRRVIPKMELAVSVAAA